MKYLFATLLACTCLDLKATNGSIGVDPWSKYKLSYNAPVPPKSSIQNPYVAIFIHAAVGIFKKKRYEGYWGYGREIMEEMLITIISNQDLMNMVHGIYVTTLGNSTNRALARSTLQSFNDSGPGSGKIFQIIEGDDLYVAEMPTLHAAQLYANESFIHRGNDIFILYLHTKGMRNNGIGATDWRKFMVYFLVDKHKICIEAMSKGGFDTCGSNLIGNKYQGNMW